MYILNIARFNKGTRKLLPDNAGNTKLWVFPATIYRKKKNAEKALEDAVKNAVEWAKSSNTFVKVHKNYEDSVVQDILPERHVFMGNTYFYGKIVSMFNGQLGGTNGANNIMKFYMMTEMM